VGLCCVERDSGRPVLHLWLNTPPTHVIFVGFFKILEKRLTGLIPLYKSIIFLLMNKIDSEELDPQKSFSLLYKVY